MESVGSVEDERGAAPDARLLVAVTKSFKRAKKPLPKDLRAFIAKPRPAHYTLGVPGFVG